MKYGSQKIMIEIYVLLLLLIEECRIMVSGERTDFVAFLPSIAFFALTTHYMISLLFVYSFLSIFI